MTAVELLQALLRCDTTNPPGNEGPAVDVLEAHLASAGLDTDVLTGPDGRPALVARLPGPPERPALVLLSHTDVVAAEAERWSRDPFGGEIADGHVWGRGALDMKGVAAMHAAAAAALARSGTAPARELILVAVPDEEAGGARGAEWLLDEHAAAVGFADSRPPPDVIAEGSFGLTGVLDRPILPIVLGEKIALKLHLHAAGEPGHGSLPPARQAPANLARLLDEVAGFAPPRVHPVMQEQFRRLAAAAGGARGAVFHGLSSALRQGLVKLLARPLRTSGPLATLLSDTATPTVIRAGYKDNVVPGEATAILDCRLLPDTDVDAFVGGIRSAAARRAVEVEARSDTSGPVSAPGRLFVLLERVSAGLQERPVVVPSLTPGFTDARFFRRRGAPGYGWVPLVLTPELLATVHGDDERIPLDGFERGVQAMTTAVALACDEGPARPSEVGGQDLLG